MTIVETWRLVQATAATANGETLQGPFGGACAMGRLTFAAHGRMMGMICDGQSELEPNQIREHTFYCDSYTYDGRRLVTRVDVSSPSLLYHFVLADNSSQVAS
jgi:hypothetical protein